MAKRLISLLICIVLLFTIAPVASAARVPNSVTLIPCAWLSTNDVFQYNTEFSNYAGGNIVLSPGDRITTPAFHAAQSSNLSFTNMSVNSSDPSVATGKLRYVGRSSVNGRADTFVGLEIVAKSVGTTIITADFDTLVARADIEDRRGSTHQTKTFQVTVSENGLDIDLAFSSNEVVVDWSQAYKDRMNDTGSWVQAKERLKAEWGMDIGEAYILAGAGLVATGVTTGIVSAALAAAGVSAVTGAGIPLAVGLVAFAAVMAIGTEVFGPPELVGSASDGVSSGISVGIDMYQNKTLWGKITGGLTGNLVGPGLTAANIELDRRKREMDNLLKFLAKPALYPGAVALNIRVTNTGSEDIQNLTVDLTSEGISLSGENGPTSDSRTVMIPHIPAGMTVEKSVQVYPKKAFAPESTNGGKVLVQEGNVAARCQYYSSTLDETVVADGAASLPIYTCLGREELKTHAADLLWEEDYRLSRSVDVDCPVDVTILDASGKELATLSKDGDRFTDGTILAMVDGDRKVLTLLQDSLDQYRFTITATDDGTMDILGMDGGDSVDLAGYEGIPLKKGQSFTMDLSGEQPVTISSGEGTIPPVRLINEATIAEDLAGTDISPVYIPLAAQAFSCGWVPDTLVSNGFQQELTMDRFCALLIHLYELGCHMGSGDLAATYLAQTGEQIDEGTLLRIARWADLLPLSAEVPQAGAEAVASAEASSADETAAPAIQPWEQPVTREVFNEATFSLMRLLGSSAHYADGLISGEKVTVGAVCAALGRLQGRLNAESTDDSALQAIAMQEALLSELTDIPLTQWRLVYRCRPEEAGTTLLRDFSVEGKEDSATVHNAGVQGIAQGRIQDLAYLMENYFPTTGTTVSAMDLKAYRAQEKSCSLLFASHGSGSYTAEDGTEYAWMPLFFSTKTGDIHLNQVYLGILRLRLDETTGTATNEFTLIADQAKVRNFINQSLAESRAYENVQDYAPLSDKMEGEAVLRLQLALAEAGFLKGEATGVYDAATAQAVQSFEKGQGMKADRIADVGMQRVLFGSSTPATAALENWLAAEPAA